MREYALNFAASHEATGVASAVSRRLINWIARRSVAKLDQLDDDQLKDIGITRDHVNWAASRPLSENAAMALHGRAWLQRGRIVR